MSSVDKPIADFSQSIVDTLDFGLSIGKALYSVGVFYAFLGLILPTFGNFIVYSASGSGLFAIWNCFALVCAAVFTSLALSKKMKSNQAGL